MAKRKGKKKGYRKNPKRVKAGKKAYKKSGLYKWNQRNKKKNKSYRKSKGKKRKGKKTKYSSKGGKSLERKAAKARAAGVKVVPKSKIQDAYRRVIDRGGTEQKARQVVARLERMRMHQIRKGVLAHEAAEKEAAAKKKAGDFADLFRKIGAEEARRAHL